MDTRSKAKQTHLAGPALTMETQDAKASSKQPHASTRDDEHGEEEETPGESFTHILREIREGNQRLATQIDSKLTEVNNAITSLDKTINGLVTRVSEAENRISNAEDTLKDLDKTVLHLRKQNDYLLEKVDQLENYSRRNNIRLINLPEGREGTIPVKFFTDWLPSALGSDNFPDPIIIERAHRALFPRPPPDKKPRPVIIRFLRYLDRERVLRAAARKERNTIQHDGTPVMLFPDVSPAVARRRKEYDQVKKELTARKIPFALLHPATLRILHEGQRRFFKTPKEAMTFIHHLHPEDEDRRE